MFNDTFYPTPKDLITKALYKIDFNRCKTFLEPSAGKGDFAEAIKEKYELLNNSRYSKNITADIDCIEIDENLQHILTGKKLRLIHNDFLSYNSFKKYDCIVLNPPFDNGEKHLLKAIKMQENGGQIVCILNAETLKNPYSNSRKELIQLLEDYNASIEYIQNAFIDAERKTYVEIALIYINIPSNSIGNKSILLNDLKQTELLNKQKSYDSNALINNDFIKGKIEQYNFEINTGLKIFDEFEALKPFMQLTFNNDSENTRYLSTTNALELSCTRNEYIAKIRSKYWRAFFESKEITELFTSNLREQYMKQISDLCNYDFSEFNILSIKAKMQNDLVKGVEDTIINLFEEFSNKFHYYDECSKNIHYYNGWKTNQAYKINKKVIIPLSCYSWSRSLQLSWGNVFDKISDIEKVFNYLDNCQTEEINLQESLKFAEGYGDTKKIDTKYFYLTFYKKGTCHIEFKNMELLHKFNIFGSQRKNWLPPTYGKSQYKDMTTEEKTVINEFEGEQSYQKVIVNNDYYIQETSSLLMLA